MASGLILRGIGGFYYVLPNSGNEIVECRARGRFRSEGMIPMVGDRVEYELQREGYAALTKILPRKNSLIRPPVANIDRLFIVLAAAAPHPDWLLADRLIIQAKLLGIEPVILLNKCDTADDRVIEAFQIDYSKHFLSAKVSARTGEGILQLHELVKDNVCCFAGQSAVGKSSLINALMPELQLETGGLAKKTDRGRHTTRRAELWPAFGGAILDTPGFSLFETDCPEQAQLDLCYPEFSDLPSACRFSGCKHLTEPDCAVKEMIQNGGMSQARYARYQILAKEFETRRKHRYD